MLEEFDPPDLVNLIKLVWHPDDFDADGNLQGTAFSRRDLEGGSRYVSVDRSDLHDPAVFVSIAKKQQPKSENRETARRAHMSCKDVRQVKDSEGIAPLVVTGQAIGHHQAHCGISNHSGKKGEAYVDQIRTLLVPLVTNIDNLPLA